MKLGSTSAACAPGCRYSRCARWPTGAAFHRAYPHATQQALLEAHKKAFAYVGGVFQVLRYDNLASAVRKIKRGHRREETVRFVAFRSYWRFAAEFCTPGEGHEKGGIEGEAATSGATTRCRCRASPTSMQ